MTWANIADFPGYQISSGGEVQSFLRRKPRILVPQLNPRTGYLQVYLRRDHKTYVRRIHMLVAETFIGPRPWGMQVCHYDRNKLNNSLLNLDYETRSENLRHHRPRTTCKWGHLYDPENILWRRREGRFYRQCKRCHATYVARWRAKCKLSVAAEYPATAQDCRPGPRP